MERMSSYPLKIVKERMPLIPQRWKDLEMRLPRTVVESKGSSSMRMQVERKERAKQGERREGNEIERRNRKLKRRREGRRMESILRK